MKFKGLALTLDMAIALSIATIMFAGGAVWAGIGWVKDYRSDLLRDECNQLEYALHRYGQNHLTVDLTSEHTDSFGKILYNKIHTYPESQEKLDELHKLGYLHSSVEFTDFQWSKSDDIAIRDSSVVFYTVNTDRTKYRIEVTLPNGTTYVTPGSSSF